MAVTSRDVGLDGQPVKGAAGGGGETRPSFGSGGAPELGAVLLLFGGLAWLGGARFTADGAVLGLNWIMGWFGVPLTIPMPSGWWLIGVAIGLGVVCSRVEIVRRPIRRHSGRLLFMGIGALVGWSVVSALDLITTYVGLTAVTTGSWAIHRSIATLPPLAAALTGLLTFAPEWAIMTGIYLLGWKRR